MGRPEVPPLVHCSGIAGLPVPAAQLAEKLLQPGAVGAAEAVWPVAV